MPRLFQLGSTFATPGALRVLDAAGVDPSILLQRHQSCDWGDLGTDDFRANQRALTDGSRILSAYRIPEGERVWVITDAKDDSGVRQSTCIMLPGEY